MEKKEAFANNQKKGDWSAFDDINIHYVTYTISIRRIHGNIHTFAFTYNFDNKAKLLAENYFYIQIFDIKYYTLYYIIVLMMSVALPLPK